MTKKHDLVKDIASTIIDVEFIETKQNIPLKTSNNNLKNTLKQNIEEEILELDNNYNNFIERTPAEKLQNISKFVQVICITHTPVVASKGDEFILVTKKTDNGETISHAEIIEGEAVVKEIASLIDGGKDVSQTALEHAKVLLNK